MDIKEQAIVKATGATLTLGLGYEPSYVRVFNMTDVTELEWTPDLANIAAARYGFALAATGDKAAVNAAANGIDAYAGGDKMTAASTVYILRNQANQAGVDVAAGSKVTQFTMDTAANKTGHFNCDVVGATIGAGSRITFSGDPKVYRIIALTAGNGDTANEVTLDANPCSNGGTVVYVSKIWPRWDYTGAASGEVIKKGITIGASATVNNTDGDVLLVQLYA
jgi:hypothetical protein